MPERYKVNRVKAWTGGGWLLFILPLPLLPALLFALLQGRVDLSIATLAAIGLFTGGALLARWGLASEADYNKRKVAKAPRLPKKLAGAITVAAGTGFCNLFILGQGLLFSAFLFLLCLLGFYLAYGLDPHRDKAYGIKQGFGYTTEEIMEAVDEAEEKIQGITDTAKQLPNPELKQRLIRIGGMAKKIIGLIEEDPRDLRRARKFLNVYLDGAHKVTTGYLKTHTKSQSDALETNFRNVLVTIEEVFAEQHQKLLENDVTELDIKIEVLATQLKHEGVV